MIHDRFREISQYLDTSFVYDVIVEHVFRDNGPFPDVI